MSHKIFTLSLAAILGGLINLSSALGGNDQMQSTNFTLSLGQHVTGTSTVSGKPFNENYVINFEVRKFGNKIFESNGPGASTGRVYYVNRRAEDRNITGGLGLTFSKGARDAERAGISGRTYHTSSLNDDTLVLTVESDARDRYSSSHSVTQKTFRIDLSSMTCSMTGFLSRVDISDPAEKKLNSTFCLLKIDQKVQ